MSAKWEITKTRRKGKNAQISERVKTPETRVGVPMLFGFFLIHINKCLGYEKTIVYHCNLYSSQ